MVSGAVGQTAVSSRAVSQAVCDSRAGAMAGRGPPRPRPEPPAWLVSFIETCQAQVPPPLQGFCTMALPFAVMILLVGVAFLGERYGRKPEKEKAKQETKEKKQD